MLVVTDKQMKSDVSGRNVQIQQVSVNITHFVLWAAPWWQLRMDE